MRGIRIAWLAIVATAAVGASVQAQAGPRGVVELFTSQGCSSCPPADELMGQLALDSSLIILTVPIDYWDYLGWKDTLAKPRHSSRQRGYAKMRGDRQVYTPQAVVNGTAQALGSDKEAIEQAVADSRKKQNVLSLAVSVTASADKVHVNIGESSSAPPAEVWICPVSNKVAVPIVRGENSGRTLIYHNVVRRWIKLGEWTGATRSFSLPLADLGPDHVDAVAVIVQTGSIERPGPMLGATLAKVP